MMQKSKTKIISILIFQLICFGLNAQSNSIVDQGINEKLKEKTFDKIEDLEGYIVSIIDKSIKVEYRKNFIDAACKLFESEDKIIETQDKISKKKRRRSIRSYFNSLLRLRYDLVTIKWVESKWLSNFIKGPDGKYYGNVRVVQAYRGENETSDAEYKLEYLDYTEKDIEVQIEVVEKEIDGELYSYHIVLLGNVKVEDIK